MNVASIASRSMPGERSVYAPPTLPFVDSMDPMGEDRSKDIGVITSERRLQRLVIVACDVGARFAREGIQCDAVAWMLAPRSLFGGARALDACQERDAFTRAVLLHGLSLGLDADPSELDAIVEGEETPDEDVVECEPARQGNASRRVSLFSCTIEGRFGLSGRCVQAFCAMIASDEETVRRRLRIRYGSQLGDAAHVREGFDARAPLAATLLSDGIRRMLDSAARDPANDRCMDLDLHVEQRFRA